MYIYKAFDLNLKKGEVLSFVGAGGKTTTIFQLSKELKELGKSVLITTTTMIYDPTDEEYNYFFLKDSDVNLKVENGTITILGDKIENGKLIGISLSKLEKIINQEIFDFILIEADGAKKYSIKAPAYYEPVVTELTSKTIGIIGLDCLGKRIGEAVHRPEIFTSIVGKCYIDEIDVQSIVKLILNEQGLFKGSSGEKILLLNKVNNEKTLSKAKKIKKILYEDEFIDNIILADIAEKKFFEGV